MPRVPGSTAHLAVFLITVVAVAPRQAHAHRRGYLWRSCHWVPALSSKPAQKPTARRQSAWSSPVWFHNLRRHADISAVVLVITATTSGTGVRTPLS